MVAREAPTTTTATNDGMRLDAAPEMTSTERMSKLYADHSATLMRFLMGYARGKPQTAEDMLQETMIRAWRHIDTVPLEFANARRWLFMVARRIVIDAARKRQTRPVEISMTDNALLAPAIDTTEETVVARSIVSAFRTLRPEQQRVLYELHLHGRSIADIADIMSLPPGTVKSRAFYGLRTLRAALNYAA